MAKQKAATAEKPKHWVPRLAVIRNRNREYLQYNRSSCKSGELQKYVTGLVFLEQEALLKYIDLLHAKMLAAGLELPKGGFADVTAAMDLEPDVKAEDEPEDVTDPDTDPEA